MAGALGSAASEAKLDPERPIDTKLASRAKQGAIPTPALRDLVKRRMAIIQRFALKYDKRALNSNNILFT